MRTLLSDEINRSIAIVRSGEEVIPRWRIITPNGDFKLMTRFTETVANRERITRLLAGFMAWKLASGYVMAGESWLGPAGARNDEALVAIGVTRSSALGAMRRIYRKPGLAFGELEWLEESAVDPSYRNLLPSAGSAIDAETMRDLETAFGAGGEFEIDTIN